MMPALQADLRGALEIADVQKKGFLSGATPAHRGHVRCMYNRGWRSVSGGVVLGERASLGAFTAF